MEVDKVISVFSELSIIQKKFERINSGGCGVVALCISEELNKRNIKHDIVWIGNFGSSAKDKKKLDKVIKGNSAPTLNDFNKTGVYLQHAMIRFNNFYFIDGSGVYEGYQNTKHSYLEIVTKIETNVLKSLVDCPYGWNPMFDRQFIPKIKRIIKKTLLKLDN
jgi:hypothetical protein